MQKLVKTTRREVGLNASLACREELFENVRVEGKNRRELKKRELKRGKASGKKQKQDIGLQRGIQRTNK